MKLQLLGGIAASLLVCGTVYADRCYDPEYHRYVYCEPEYSNRYYPEEYYTDEYYPSAYYPVEAGGLYFGFSGGGGWRGGHGGGGHGGHGGHGGWHR